MAVAAICTASQTWLSVHRLATCNANLCSTGEALEASWLGTKYMLMWHLFGLASSQQQGYIDTHVAAWVVPLAQLTLCGCISDMAISQTAHPVGTVRGAPSFSFAIPTHARSRGMPRPPYQPAGVAPAACWGPACICAYCNKCCSSCSNSQQSVTIWREPANHKPACANQAPGPAWAGPWWLGCAQYGGQLAPWS